LIITPYLFYSVQTVSDKLSRKKTAEPAPAPVDGGVTP
jgi:hypothetical protein